METIFKTAQSHIIHNLTKEVPDNGMHYQWILHKQQMVSKLSYETYLATLEDPLYKEYITHPTFNELYAVVYDIYTEMIRLQEVYDK
jgi:hypothetical protein